MELADVPDSKSGGSDTVPVRPRSPAPKIPNASAFGIFTSYLFTIHYSLSAFPHIRNYYNITELLFIYSVCNEGSYTHILVLLHRFSVVNRPTGEGNACLLKLFDFLLAVYCLVTVKADAYRRIVKTLFCLFAVQL